VYKIFGAMSKDICSEISAHFGIDSVENSVANRRSVITFDRLGRCFRFVYVYARVLLCFCVATVSGRTKI